MKHIKKFNNYKIVESVENKPSTNLEWQHWIKDNIKDTNAIKNALEEGLDPNFENGFTLRYAAREGNLELIKILVEEYGANIDIRYSMPLKWACEYSNYKTVKLLLDLGAKNIDDISKNNCIGGNKSISGEEKKKMFDLLK